MLKICKMTSKGQVTVPREVRRALGVKPGDMIAWEVGDGGVVTVRGVEPVDYEYLQALEKTLGEWSSKEDEEAYGEL
ncbi:MAG: AbrB/MazE/SpoVT family DNA-binding domain-containing protein [Deltaproteobacteria bacterium]|nr:MAG: AbrB/MazE/SpoVT family DNA-binding domain-containing protein [Deltaproteobacteria bacterium]